MKREPSLFKYLGDFSEQALSCIRCGFCNSVCPTSNITQSFSESLRSRGRMIMIQSILEDEGILSLESKGLMELMDMCFGCRRCIEVCPAGIRIPDVIAMFRNVYYAKKGIHKMNLGYLILSHYTRIEKIMHLASPLSNIFINNRFMRISIEALTGIHRNSPLPDFKKVSFRKMFKKISINRNDKVLYIVDSFANYNYPNVAVASFVILNKIGYSVIPLFDIDPGIVMLERGMRDRAIRIARNNIEHVKRFIDRVSWVVTSSPTVLLAFRDIYKEILGKRLDTVSEKVVDVIELVSDALNKNRLKLIRQKGNIVYHSSCFSKYLGIDKITVNLFENVGYDVKVVKECCGIAGVWGMMKKNISKSYEILKKLKSSIGERCNMVTSSETCFLQLSKVAGYKVNFPVEVISKVLNTSKSD